MRLEGDVRRERGVRGAPSRSCGASTCCGEGAADITVRPPLPPPPRMRFIVLAAVPLGRKAVPRLISETSTTRRSMHRVAELSRVREGEQRTGSLYLNFATMCAASPTLSRCGNSVLLYQAYRRIDARHASMRHSHVRRRPQGHSSLSDAEAISALLVQVPEGVLVVVREAPSTP